MFISVHRRKKEGGYQTMIVQSTQISALWDADDGGTMLVLAGGAGGILIGEPVSSVIEAFGGQIQIASGWKEEVSDGQADQADVQPGATPSRGRQRSPKISVSKDGSA